MWTEWTEWTECTATCGGGEQTRVRECVLPKGVQGCPGDNQESRNANYIFLSKLGYMNTYSKGYIIEKSYSIFKKYFLLGFK